MMLVASVLPSSTMIISPLRPLATMYAPTFWMVCSISLSSLKTGITTERSRGGGGFCVAEVAFIYEYCMGKTTCCTLSFQKTLCDALAKKYRGSILSNCQLNCWQIHHQNREVLIVFNGYSRFSRSLMLIAALLAMGIIAQILSAVRAAHQ